MSKRKFHIPARGLQVPPPKIMFPIFARDYMQTERELLPRLIKDKNTLNPIAMLTVIALRMNQRITGKSFMEPDLLLGAIELLKILWQEGYYTPSPDYPYTLEETLQEVQG